MYALRIHKYLSLYSTRAARAHRIFTKCDCAIARATALRSHQAFTVSHSNALMDGVTNSSQRLYAVNLRLHCSATSVMSRPSRYVITIDAQK
ncbi:hypothetical protein EXIGLDRAFT_455878 [Exidia glandulosa HHB12029]|uniref:Uncharacterized protein n=1 Tax=Exidia glandulosa HHB12029 TaxID=1314781 RepID=A0A166BM16_EXIGL|nr:hypothetical protein EXIGLDRAFT_455878 [Exidia glandulosa HHB12029]